MRYLILFFCFSSVISNYLVFKSNISQSKLFEDLNKNHYTFDFESLTFQHIQYPSLAINSVPITTYISRYYTNFNDYETALFYLDKSLKSNPYDIYTNYIIARNYVQKNEFLLAKNKLQEIFESSPKIESSTILYLSVLGTLNRYDELLNIYPIIRDIDNKIVSDFYESNLKLSKKNN